MSIELDRVENYFKTFNAHDLTAITDLFTDDGVIVGADGLRREGAQGVRRFFEEIIEIYPDARCELKQAWESQGSVAVEWEFTGTRSDQDKQSTLVGAELFIFHRDKIKEMRIYDAKAKN